MLSHVTRWGAHPILAPALAAFPDEQLPDEIERSLPARRKLATHELLTVARLCIEHARPRVGRASRAEFDRLAALAERQHVERSTYSAQLLPWQIDLSHVRRDVEHARGATRIAAIAAYVAWLDLMRGGREAASFAAQAVEQTAKLVRADAAALHAFALALCREVA
jgi:hypothetical protein